MKRLVIVPLAALALATTARATDQAMPQPPTDQPPVMTRSGPGQAVSSTNVTLTAKVTAVDQEKRLITLKGKDGKTQTFKVGPDVKRLNEIHAGDTIVLNYQQGVLLQFLQKGEQGQAASGAIEVSKTGAEAPPSVEATGQVRGMVTVKKVDMKTRVVTLETRKGEMLKVMADQSIDLKKVKPGQRYDGVYSESLALSVEKAEAVPAKATAPAAPPHAK